MSKEKNLQYLKNFSKISITDVARRIGVDRTNLVLGRTSAEKIEKAKELIESDVAKLYIKEEK